jgi:hypothetical protein
MHGAQAARRSSCERRASNAQVQHVIGPKSPHGPRVRLITSSCRHPIRACFAQASIDPGPLQPGAGARLSVLDEGLFHSGHVSILAR